jgi:hypothetical protein
VVGDQGLAAHFDGAAWSTDHVGTGATLIAVHGTAPNDVWAVSNDGSILHWDGSTWKTATQSPYATLIGVWANSASDVWACGEDNNMNTAYVLHWDGTSWQEAGDSNFESFWRIWSSGADNVWIVGSDFDGTGAVVHGTNARFADVAFKGAAARGVWGTSSSDVWVSAYDGTITHWDGASWASSARPGASEALLGMSGSAPDDAWAVGLGGTVEHYDGRSWSPVTVPTTSALAGVWTDGPNNTWIAGGSSVLSWDGATWEVH